MCQKKVSVVVPIYNVEKYVVQCIDSILKQTYKNIEIILVDDGSTDESAKLCDLCGKRDNRIKVYHKTNGGLSDARNYGINKASGEYIIFIDGDDYVHKEFIKSLVVALENGNADMSICSFSYVGTIDEELSKMKSPIQTEIISSDDFLKNKLFGYNYWYWVVAWNKLYKRNLFDKIRYPLGKQNEDEFVIHEIVSNCNKIACISRPLYYYVQRNTSIMGKSVSIKNYDAVEAMFKRGIFFKKYPEGEEYSYFCLLKGLDFLEGISIRYIKSGKILLDREQKNRIMELQKDFDFVYGLSNDGINRCKKYLNKKECNKLSIARKNLMLAIYPSIIHRMLKKILNPFKWE